MMMAMDETMMQLSAQIIIYLNSIDWNEHLGTFQWWYAYTLTEHSHILNGAHSQHRPMVKCGEAKINLS